MIRSLPINDIEQAIVVLGPDIIAEVGHVLQQDYDQVQAEDTRKYLSNITRDVRQGGRRLDREEQSTLAFLTASKGILGRDTAQQKTGLPVLAVTSDYILQSAVHRWRNAACRRAACGREV